MSHLARLESLTPRDQRVFRAAHGAISRALLPRRWVPPAERDEAAYMVLSAIHAELPHLPAESRALLRAGRTAVYLTPSAFTLGVRFDPDAIRVLLPFWEIRWQR